MLIERCLFSTQPYSRSLHITCWISLRCPIPVKWLWTFGIRLSKNSTHVSSSTPPIIRSTCSPKWPTSCARRWASRRGLEARTPLTSYPCTKYSTATTVKSSRNTGFIGQVLYQYLALLYIILIWDII